MVNESNDDNIGKQIKSYTILQKLGSGGCASVYLVQNHLNRLAAIKLLKTKHLRSEIQQLFLQEAHFLQVLKTHPYILPILDWGESEETPYIVVEYMEGGTLRERLNYHRPLNIQEAFAILLQLGEAITASHRHQIIHCDLKPENILFNTEGDAILADFGIAVQLGATDKLCSIPRGTYAYMAPEQFDGTFSKESDQYSLGCIAYELLAGRHPFEHLRPFTPQDHRTMKERHQNAQILSLTTFNKTIPEYMDQAILQSMAKDPSERHLTTAAFLRALQSPTTSLNTPLPSTPEELQYSASSPYLVPAFTGIKIHEMDQFKREHNKVAQDVNYWKPPKYHFPENSQKEKNQNPEQRHTDYSLPLTISNIPAKTRKPPQLNPFTTYNLQLPADLLQFIAPVLKDLGFTHCLGTTPDKVFIDKVWTFSALKRTHIESTESTNDLVPGYALIHIPRKFLIESKDNKTTQKNIDCLKRIFPLFPQWNVIIFTDSKYDIAPPIARTLEDEGQHIYKITMHWVKEGNMNELKKVHGMKESRKQWGIRYLKLQDIPSPVKRLAPEDKGILEEILANFLLYTDVNRAKDILMSTSSLQEKAHNMEFKGDSSVISSRIISHLNEPPYQLDRNNHTMLGAFLCGLLQEEIFPSRNIPIVKNIVRKYGLGPPGCHCT